MIPKTCKEAFKVLGLSEGASIEEINKAYRKLALEWHGFVASHLILVVIYDKYHVAISNLAIPISVN